MSQDKNNNQFILRFTNGSEQVALDDTYTVEVLTKFTKSGTSRLTSAVVRRGYATWEFDTDYITQNETVYNYVYVRRSGNLVVSADSNAFYFEVGLSEIDKDAGRVAETYDENYQKYLDSFKDNVDLEKIAQVEQGRVEAENNRELAEDERENAEEQRKTDHANRSAEFDGKADKKQEDWITPTLLNGAISYPDNPVMYMKDEMGFVHFSGGVKGKAGVVSLNVPRGYRFSDKQSTIKKYIANTSSARTAGDVQINYVGNVYIIPPNSDAWVYLDGVSYKEGD